MAATSVSFASVGQVGKVADLALDRLQHNLVCRGVYISGGLRALVHCKVLLHHRVRAGVVGYVGVCRQRVPILQQLVRDDSRAVVPNINVHAAAKASILIVDLFDAVAVGDLDPPPCVPLPQRPSSICNRDFHVVPPLLVFAHYVVADAWVVDGALIRSRQRICWRTGL